MSAVCCCGQPPRVVVATARCRVPTPHHSTSLTFTSLLSLSLAAAGVGSPGPRLHAHHSAAPGAPWRREAHRRAVRSSRGAVPAPPHYPVYPATHWHHTHTHNFHYLLTFIGRAARWEHSGWFCSLLGPVDGSISRIRSIRNMQPTSGEGDLKWSELYLL